jgi:tetratricopeptide (TPR) repeat protein
LYSSERDYSKAISCTQAAVQYLEQVGDLWGVNQAWMSLADYFIFSGDIEQAFHAYDIIRKFSENAGNRRILGISLSWESLAVSRYGDLNRALELRKRSQEIAVEIGNQSDIAWHTWELGEVYRLLADIDRAKQYYQEAYPVFEKLQDYLGCGYFHRGMGDIAIMMGDWEAAKSEFLQALGFQEREQRNLTTWALIYYHSKLGYCLAKSGAYNEAKMQLREAISLTETWHWPDIISLPMLGMAALLAETGSPAEAIEIASCIASKRTTWNEVKKQAQLVASEASHSIPEEQTVQAKERGESLDIHQLVRSYLDSPHLTILSVEG